MGNIRAMQLKYLHALRLLEFLDVLLITKTFLFHLNFVDILALGCTLRRKEGKHIIEN